MPLSIYVAQSRRGMDESGKKGAVEGVVSDVLCMARKSCCVASLLLLSTPGCD